MRRAERDQADWESNTPWLMKKSAELRTGLENVGKGLIAVGLWREMLGAGFMLGEPETSEQATTKAAQRPVPETDF